MLLATTDTIEGKRTVEVYGLVSGNTARARFFGRDIVAALRSVVGGEVKEYSQLLAQAREEALRRMVSEAEKLGANAVVGIRLGTSDVMGSVSEILAYGTAVRVE